MRHREGVNSKPLPLINKILIIRLSSFGDIVLTFPLVKKIKELFPYAEIHYLTKEEYKDFVLFNPLIDKVICPYKSLIKTRKDIGIEKYDLIFDIHKNFRSYYLSLFNGKSVKRYTKENFKKFLLVNFKKNLFKEIIPVYKKYLLTLKKYLKESDLVFTTTELKFDKDRIIKRNYIVVSPSSRHFTKTYPVAKFIEYISSAADKHFVLVGDDSDNDKEICKRIELKCSNVLNKCGMLSKNELANVLYYSEHVICNDSAILHLAEALGKKAVAIFGSTVKEFGFFPQLKHSKVLEVRDLSCRPCTHIGLKKCPKKHFKCMEDIQLIIDN